MHIIDKSIITHSDEEPTQMVPSRKYLTKHDDDDDDDYYYYYIIRLKVAVTHLPSG